jgi:hypothetical protein
MTRGETPQTKVHFKGKEDDFIIFVDDAKSARNWRMNKSVPLERVVSAFQIFVTHKLVLVFILINLSWSAPRLSPPRLSPPRLSPPRLSPPRLSPPRLSPPRLSLRVLSLRVPNCSGHLFETPIEILLLRDMLGGIS